MLCPVCHGSGITRVTHLRETFTLPAACGGCGGTGVRPDDEEDTRPLFDQMLAKQVEILDAISDEPNLPSAVRRRWRNVVDGISVTQADAATVLRELRNEIDAAEFRDCRLGLIFTYVGDLARMSEDYQQSAGRRDG